MNIQKSEGVTKSERLLATLCDQTFLKLWSYPNPYKDDGKELCDLLVIFDDIVFVFFDREKYLDMDADKDPIIAWERWSRRVIEAQTKTAFGAERYLKSGRSIYLDNTLTTPLPVKRSPTPRVVHKIIVAHGASEACKQASDSNVFGSLAICYGELQNQDPGIPFFVHLDREQPVHVLDTHNLPIILSELDTLWDFSDYLDAKMAAIKTLDALMYCGEEDLLAHYFLNYDIEKNKHFIGTQDASINMVMVGEGEWNDFVQSPVYKRTRSANQKSYLWDDLIQRTSENALAGRLLGDSQMLQGRSAIHEMAKEPRFSRRALSDQMFRAVENFPGHLGKFTRDLCLMPSFYPEKKYLFLQVRAPEDIRKTDDFRRKRQVILEIACGSAKNAHPEIDTIIGIGIDAPKFSPTVSEDFLLMECRQWSEEQQTRYASLNEGFEFFQSNPRESQRRVSRFIPANQEPKK